MVGTQPRKLIFSLRGMVGPAITLFIGNSQTARPQSCFLNDLIYLPVDHPARSAAGPSPDQGCGPSAFPGPAGPSTSPPAWPTNNRRSKSPSLNQQQTVGAKLGKLVARDGVEPTRRAKAVDLPARAKHGKQRLESKPASKREDKK
jgi:hypothetical protein